MTTEMFEVFSLEEGDTIIVKGEQFVILDIAPADGDEVVLTLADEDGFTKTCTTNYSQRFRVVCEAADDDV